MQPAEIQRTVDQGCEMTIKMAQAAIEQHKAQIVAHSQAIQMHSMAIEDLAALADAAETAKNPRMVGAGAPQPEQKERLSRGDRSAEPVGGDPVQAARAAARASGDFR